MTPQTGWRRFGSPFQQPKPDAISLERIYMSNRVVPIVIHKYKWLMRQRPNWTNEDYIHQAKILIRKDKKCLKMAEKIFGKR